MGGQTPTAIASASPRCLPVQNNALFYAFYAHSKRRPDCLKSAPMRWEAKRRLHMDRSKEHEQAQPDSTAEELA